MGVKPSFVRQTTHVTVGMAGLKTGGLDGPFPEADELSTPVYQARGFGKQETSEVALARRKRRKPERSQAEAADVMGFPARRMARGDSPWKFPGVRLAPAGGPVKVPALGLAKAGGVVGFPAGSVG